MMEGSCLCGAVAWRADCEPQPIILCHCETCRKTHGSAFASSMQVKREVFSWVRGADKVGGYESSPGKIRHFCTLCGSHMVADRTTTEFVMLRLGTLDTKIEARPAVHIWRSDGASWYDPGHVAPELPEGFDFGALKAARESAD